MSRDELIAIVAAMVASGSSAQDIVDSVIEALTPDDDDECPVCGIAP